MTSIGFTLAAISLFFLNVGDKTRINMTDIIYTFFFIAGCSMVFLGVAMKLWEVMP